MSADMSAPRSRVAALAILLVARLGDLHHHAVLQVARDGAITAGDDLLAFGHAALDLDRFVALDAGGHLLGDRLAVFDHEDQLDEAVLAGLEGLAFLAELIRRAHGHRLDRYADRLGLGR